jgi:hypothetical protein
MTTTANPPHAREHEPVPDASTLIGFLHVLRKAHIELDGKDVAHERFNRISTRGDARQYIDEVMPRLMAERAKRRRHRHGRDPQPGNR